MKKIPLHVQILVAMFLGVLFGFLLIGQTQFTTDWIKPFGTIFINLLKLVAVPLVIASLITGISSMSNMSHLSYLGSRAIFIYLSTTIIAVSIGISLAGWLKPGSDFPAQQRDRIKNLYSQSLTEKAQVVQQVSQNGPLQPLLDIFPSNFFLAASDNRNMLQVIVFVILFGIALVMSDPVATAPVKLFFTGVSEVIIKMVVMIMRLAPLGVFALMTSLIVDFAGDSPKQAFELLVLLALYATVVLLGLSIFTFLVYPLMILIWGKVGPLTFFKGIFPAQMMGFTTSSSAATLPVSMDCVVNKLGVSKQTASFVLPLGATVNMDGTSLYQAVAAVFIAQAYGLDLGTSQIIGLIFMVVVASIGTPAVPGAGLVMMIVILEQTGIPAEGLALILAPDRILDMCRTVVNITGDSAVCLILDRKEEPSQIA
jgi:Na+/H+-dicarboxylate symporter